MKERYARQRYRRILTVIALLVLSAPVFAGQMYRYEDDDGSQVISNTLPQKAIERGYEILSSSGRVVEEVPPPPTEEEREARRRQAEEERLEQERRERQREADRQLLRQYSTPDDVVQALHRKLRELMSQIRLKQGNINNLQGQLAEKQSEAANLERAGDSVPDSIYEDMDRIRSEKSNAREEIRGQMEVVEETRAQYRKQIERMETLTDQQRTLPLTIPEEKDVERHLQAQDD